MTYSLLWLSDVILMEFFYLLVAARVCVLGLWVFVGRAILMFISDPGVHF